MSFLDRFQNKIATVTAQGHLKKADGSEEIRVGPPKRKCQNGTSTIGKASVVINNLPVEKTTQKASPKRGHAQYNEDNWLPGRPQDDSLLQQASPNSKYKEEEKKLKLKSNQQQQQSVPSEKSSNLPSKREPQKACQSPRDRNEALVHTNDDQLIYSRKARPVQFAPCTLSQYKKEKPSGYYELGKLQPDLNAEELVQKRANAERIKAFSKSLRGINKETVPTSKKTTTEEEDIAQKKSKSTREKALAFAKHIPKPRIVQRPLAEPSGMLSSASSNESLPVMKFSRPNAVDDENEEEDVSLELQELQMRHQASRAQVEALMRS